MAGVDVEFTLLEDFEFWLEEMEDKACTSVKKPATRAEAKQLLSNARKLKKEVERRTQPEELLDDSDPKAVDLLERYKVLLVATEDNLKKVESLCSCWDKINEDLSELTNALSGGASKMTLEKLETQIEEIKDMFRERAKIIDNLTPAEL